MVPSFTPSKWSNFVEAFHRNDLDGRGLMNVGRRLKTYRFLRLNFSHFTPEGVNVEVNLFVYTCVFIHLYV